MVLPVRISDALDNHPEMVKLRYLCFQKMWKDDSTRAVACHLFLFHLKLGMPAHGESSYSVLDCFQVNRACMAALR